MEVKKKRERREECDKNDLFLNKIFENQSDDDIW